MANSRSTGRSPRAQTTIDFAIGAGVFLVAIAFIIAFMPAMFSPYLDGTQEETVAADRMAGQLSKGVLADPERPYLLDSACTVDFFNDSQTSPPPDCRFDQSVTDVREKLGVDDRFGLRVELREPGEAQEALCWNASAEAVVPEESGACDPDAGDTVFVTGDELTEVESVVVARRSITIDGREGTLFVRVW